MLSIILHTVKTVIQLYLNKKQLIKSLINKLLIHSLTTKKLCKSNTKRGWAKKWVDQ